MCLVVYNITESPPMGIFFRSCYFPIIDLLFLKSGWDTADMALSFFTLPTSSQLINKKVTQLKTIPSQYITRSLSLSLVDE